MRILAFMLFFHSFASCQQAPEIDLTAEAAIAAASTSAAAWKSPEKILPSETGLVFRSTDGGLTWQDVSAGLPKGLPVMGIVAIESQVFLIAEKALYRSTSNRIAPTWEKEVFMNEKVSHFFPGRAGTYALSYWNGLFQEILPGIWEPVHTDLKDKSVRTILETPDEAVFVGCDSGIFKSADGGKTWEKVFNEGMVLNIVESNGVLVAGGSKGLLRSTDGGEHWNWVLTEGGVGIETERIEGRIAAITYNGRSETRRLRTSTDNGKTWQPIDAGLSPSQFISNINQVGEFLFCSHPTGIFRSADQGETWELVLPAAKGTMFNFTVSGRAIYAIVGGFGC